MSREITPLYTAPPKHDYVIDCPRCGHCCAEREWVGLEKHMSGDHNMFQKATSYLSGEAFWRTAEDQAPPLGVKMLLLNPSGVCVIGTWDDWAVAWAPLPKVPAHIKHILLEKSTWL